MRDAGFGGKEREAIGCGFSGLLASKRGVLQISGLLVMLTAWRLQGKFGLLVWNLKLQ